MRLNPNNSNRGPRDFFPTPPEVTQAFLEREPFSGCVWEPACGDGHMVGVLKDYFDFVDASDITMGYDFLESTDDRYHNIITNPPFKLATEFVLHARSLAKQKVAMFLRLAFLESKKRYDLFKDENFPLKKVYVMSSRVKLSLNGEGKGSGMVPYAWFVWDRAHRGPAEIDWILLDGKV